MRQACDGQNVEQALIIFFSCRLTEAVHHNGEAIKGIVNEQLGDGIVSAIDFFCTVKAIKGKNGEDRVVISMNGKFLPFIEQNVADITE